MQTKDHQQIDLNLGFSRPVAPKFLRLRRSMMVGDVTCREGDVLEVQPSGAKPSALMPVDSRLYLSRATALVQDRLATWHQGPATVDLGHSLTNPAARLGIKSKEERDQEEFLAQVERTSDPRPASAERATATPQRKGTM